MLIAIKRIASNIKPCRVLFDIISTSSLQMWSFNQR